MKRFVPVLLLVVGAAAIPSGVVASATNKPSHASYALGRAKSCRAGFHKVTARHKVHGKIVRYVECVWTVPAPVKVTAPAPTTPSPEPADPPTVVTVASDDNPALVGDQVTFTVTVATSAISSTTGQLEVFDNGNPLSGCDPISNPTFPGNGTVVGTCTTTYENATSDVIVGIYTGDATFAQSAGSLTETVNAPVLVPPMGPTSGSGGSSSGGGNTGISTTTTIPPVTTTTNPPSPTTTTTVAPSAVIGWVSYHVGGVGFSGSPPNPIVTTTGTHINLFAWAVGNLSGDTYPQGSLSFDVSGGSNYTATNAEGWGSSDCSDSYNGVGAAVGACAFVFNSAGSYTIEISFNSNDSNYQNVTNGLTEVVNVS